MYLWDTIYLPKEIAVHMSLNEGVNDKDICDYTGISKRAMRWLRETYYESKETREVVRTPLDAGRPHLLEPGAISTVFTEFYVYQNEPSGMAAPSPQVSEIKESQLRLCYIFFVRPIDTSLAVRNQIHGPLPVGSGLWGEKIQLLSAMSYRKYLNSECRSIMHGK